MISATIFCSHSSHIVHKKQYTPPVCIFKKNGNKFICNTPLGSQCIWLCKNHNIQKRKKKHEKFLLSSKFFLSVKIPCSTEEASTFTSRSIASAYWSSVLFSHFSPSHLPPPFLWKKLTGLGIYWETMTAVNIPYRRNTRWMSEIPELKSVSCHARLQVATFHSFVITLRFAKDV